MPRSTTDPAIKAAALADLLGGDQPADVAERYGINAATVRKWKERLDLPSHPVTHPVTRNVAPDVTVIRRPTIEDHQRRIHDLMYRLLIAKLEASERLAQHTTTGWLDRQSAEGMAELGDYLDRTAAGILALLVRRGGGADEQRPELARDGPPESDPA